MTPQEQVDALLDVQRCDHDIEEALHQAHVLEVRPFAPDHEHISRTFDLTLDSGHRCIFKPSDGPMSPLASGLWKQALVNYGQTPISTTISECAAWQLAKRLGSPWIDLVAPTVMKFARLPDTNSVTYGAAVLFRGGAAGKRGFYDAVPDQVSSAAFFDALIGQQDRNRGNVLWYEQRQLIYLIDHSFCFGTPGANRGANDLLDWRFSRASPWLNTDEKTALESLVESPDALTLARFVEPERIDALRARATRMLDGNALVRDL